MNLELTKVSCVSDVSFWIRGLSLEGLKGSAWITVFNLLEEGWELWWKVYNITLLSGFKEASEPTKTLRQVLEFHKKRKIFGDAVWGDF